MGQHEEVSQRDLRLGSKEIMDAVEAGESFTVTRDGRQIGELVPMRERRRYVPRTDFTFGRQLAVTFDIEQFREDLDSVLAPALADPYDR